MILYAGSETTAIESTGEYLTCNGRDVFVNQYQNLYNVIGRKFGYYPELGISASRTTLSQPIQVHIDHDDVNIYGYSLSTGIISFQTGSGGTFRGVYTVTSAKAGLMGSTQLLRPNNPTVSFTGLGAATYNFTITEINTNSSSVFPVKINLQGTNTTSSFTAGTIPVISFNPTSNVAYDSKFYVTDVNTDQTSEGNLNRTATGTIITQVPATLMLPENSTFTCSISRHSGSYHGIQTARLKQSSQILTFMGENSSSFSEIYGTFSSSFFIPSVNNSTGSVPENMGPSNAQITGSGAYRYAFRYLIKT
jgi:hypothetical protein